jgi:AcrR family transcriptional regulator
MTEAGHALPAGVQLLWGLRQPPRRGPKPAFTLDEVVAAAIDVADADGLAAVSMARVAEQLGSSTMALYRYVASKDELLLLMSDAAIGPPPVFRGRRDWRSRLRQWALAVRDVWWNRPWLLQLPVSGPPSGPNNLLWFDACLSALEDTPLDDGERVGVVLVVSTYARGALQLSVDLAAASESDPDSVNLAYSEMADLVDRRRYPALAAMIARGTFEEVSDNADEDFKFGLDVILDGIAERIARASV